MKKRRAMVVLVHGLGANRLVMKPIELHLRRGGFDTLNWGYASLIGGIERHGRRLSDAVQEIDRRRDIDSIFLVTHSMGGIVARLALSQTSFEKVKRLVMLGPPNQGSRAASFFASGLGWLCKPLSQLSDADDSFVNQLPTPDNVEIGIIAASFDRVVAVESTHLSTEMEHRVVPSGHTRMLFRRDVAGAVESFLLHGCFDRKAFGQNVGFGQVPLCDPPLSVLAVTNPQPPSRALPSPSST